MYAAVSRLVRSVVLASLWATTSMVLAGQDAADPQAVRRDEVATPTRESSPEFVGREEVLAVELVVEATEKQLSRWSKDHDGATWPRVLVDGIEVPLLSVDVSDSEGPTESSPSGEWHQVVYVDADLCATDAIAWAAEILAARAEQLVAHGPVEVLLVEESPRRLIGPTRDAEALALALSGLQFDDPGRGVLTDLRRQVQEVTTAPDRGSLTDAERQQITEALRQEEARLVEQRLDLLLSTVAGDLLDLRPTTPRRALYWVTSGYDPPPTPRTGDPTVEPVFRTIGAYGWTVFPLLRPPPAAPLLPGKRIGKLRITGVGITEAGDPTGKDDGPLIPVVSMTWEEDRKPKRARASHELGLAHLEAGAFTSAEHAFRQAIRFFHGDPRTAEEQADSWYQLSVTLEALGRFEESRRAALQVERLRQGEQPTLEDLDSDPQLAALPKDPEDHSTTATKSWQNRLESPETPLRAAALATAGQLIRGGTDLERALESLARRAVLTVQLSARPRGDLLPVEVRSAEAMVAAPGWIRSGVPPALASSRLRLLLRDGLLVDDATIRVQLVELVQEEERIEATLEWSTDPDSARGPFRVSSALVSESAAGIEAVIEQLEPTDESGQRWSWDAPPDAAMLILLVEDLSSQDWGAVFDDLESL